MISHSCSNAIYCAIVVILLCYAPIQVDLIYGNAKITNIDDGKLWLRNENQCITWEYSNAEIGSVDIRLMCGDSANAELKYTFITNFDVSRRAYHFVVPPNLQPRSDYFIQMICYSRSGRILERCYTGRFQVSQSYGAHTEPVQEPPKPPPASSTTFSNSTTNSKSSTTKTSTATNSSVNIVNNQDKDPSSSYHYELDSLHMVYFAIFLGLHIGLVLPFLL